MMLKAVFTQNAKVLGEFPIQVDKPGDLEAGSQAAFAEARRAFPGVSLFGLSVRFEKMEDDNAHRT